MTAVGYALVGGNGTATRARPPREPRGGGRVLVRDPGRAIRDRARRPRRGPRCTSGASWARSRRRPARSVSGRIVDIPDRPRDRRRWWPARRRTAQALMPGRFFLALSAAWRGRRDGPGSDGDRRVDHPRAVASRRRHGCLGTRLDIGERRIHALPGPLPPVYLAAADATSAREAARFGDGLIGTDGAAAVPASFQAAGGRGPRIGRVAVCWAATAGRGRDLAHGQAAACGPDPARPPGRDRGERGGRLRPRLSRAGRTRTRPASCASPRASCCRLSSPTCCGSPADPRATDRHETRPDRRTGRASRCRGDARSGRCSCRPSPARRPTGAR